MPIRMDYSPEFDLMIQVGTSAVSVEEYKEAKRAEMVRGDHGPSTGWIIDTRDVDVDPAWVRAIAEFIAEEWPEIRNPAALIAGNPRTAALTLLFSAIEDRDRNRPIEVFSSVRTAVEWLGRDPAVCTAEALGLQP